MFHWLNILTEWGLKFFIICDTKMEINTYILRLCYQCILVQDCYSVLVNCFFYLSVIIINKGVCFFLKVQFGIIILLYYYYYKLLLFIYKYYIWLYNIFLIKIIFFLFPFLSWFQVISFSIFLDCSIKVLEILLLSLVISCVLSFLCGFLCDLDYVV